jgi:hypothetical protein
MVVVHGDGVRPEGGAYRKRHPILRHAAFRWTAQRVLHLDRIADLVARTSGTRRQVERHARGEDGGPKHAAPLLEAWAGAPCATCRPPTSPSRDTVTFPALVEVAPGRYYVNSGDWIAHMSYASIPADGPPQLRAWPH